LRKQKSLQPDRLAFYSYAHVPGLRKWTKRFKDEDIPKDEKREYETGKKLLLKNWLS
jgi:oxygen-independent coproporphyrinogen-3 oxidase